MIITLEDAKKIFVDVTQDDLDGIEQAIRELTHNNFQNRNVRLRGFLKFEDNKIYYHGDETGFVKGKTIQASNSKYNDGLYLINEVKPDYIEVEGDVEFISSTVRDSMITLIQYPADVIAGVRKLLKYDKQMGNKMGIKSETISRWTRSFIDINSGESVNGYPAAYMKFIVNHRKMKGW